MVGFRSASDASAPGGDAPGAAGGQQRVIALLDHRTCSTASLLTAAPLALGHAVALEVLVLRSDIWLWRSLAAMGMAAGLSLAVDEDHELAMATFALVARTLAPSGVSWTFQTVAEPQDAVAACRDAHRTVVVIARHRGRFGRGRRLLATAQAAGRRSAGGHTLLVTGCGHEEPAPIDSRRRERDRGV